MKLVEFNLFQHYELINSWLRDYNKTPQPLSSFPAIGYVAYNEDHPIAAGFLRRVEGGYAQIDGVIANRNVQKDRPKDRTTGIDLVIEQLLTRAKELKIDHVIAFTGDKIVLERSFTHGFVPLEQTMVAVNLSADAHVNPSGAV